MAQQVHEIMNRELFTVRPSERADRVRSYLVALGIGAAPVLDDEHRPIGFVSLRDIAKASESTPVDRVMTSPAICIAQHETIHAAAERMDERGHHHLVVVDEGGRAVGYVGALDVIRGLLGRAVPHPDAFPHYDPELGLTWSSETALELAAVTDVAPDGPGLFVLVRGVAGAPDRIVWSEATPNVKTRLIDILSIPRSAPPHVQTWVDRGELRFRAAAAPSTRALHEAVERVRRTHRPRASLE